MTLPAAALMLVLLGIVLWIVLSPLSAIARPGRRRSNERADLEAQREAKYQEIRDAEMDFETGKLSVEDHQAVDGTLRSEAVAILDRLRALDEVEGEAGQAEAAATG
jgi:hypothetical protein